MAALEILIVALAAFGANLPLGRVRARCRRYSLSWFVAIHASIPAIVALRLLLGVAWGWAPLFVAAAVAGQVVGGRSRGVSGRGAPPG